MQEEQEEIEKVGGGEKVLELQGEDEEEEAARYYTSTANGATSASRSMHSAIVSSFFGLAAMAMAVVLVVIWRSRSRKTARTAHPVG